MGVVEYDWRLGGGVPTVKSEKRWEEECAVSEDVTFWRTGLFIGISRQRLANAALKDRSFDALDIVRLFDFVQCNKGMVDMRPLHAFDPAVSISTLCSQLV